MVRGCFPAGARTSVGARPGLARAAAGSVVGIGRPGAERPYAGARRWRASRGVGVGRMGFAGGWCVRGSCQRGASRTRWTPAGVGCASHRRHRRCVGSRSASAPVLAAGHRRAYRASHFSERARGSTGTVSDHWPQRRDRSDERLAFRFWRTFGSCAGARCVAGGSVRGGSSARCCGSCAPRVGRRRSASLGGA